MAQWITRLTMDQKILERDEGQEAKREPRLTQKIDSGRNQHVPSIHLHDLNGGKGYRKSMRQKKGAKP